MVLAMHRLSAPTLSAVENLLITYTQPPHTQVHIHVAVVQLLSRVRLFVTPWTAAHQASLSITNSQSLLKLMSIESVVIFLDPSPTISSSVIPFSSCLQSFPASGSFPMSGFFASGGQRIGASVLASVLPMNNIQGWFSLGLTGLISSQSKGFSRVFSNTTVQKHQFFGAQLSLWSSRELLFLIIGCLCRSVG